MSSRPNVIFILADDLGYADLGCTGARDEHNAPANVSPRLDRLATEGLRFTHGYSNSAVCSPTRFALITGRWQYRLRGAAEEPIANAHGDKVLGIPPDHPTLPSLLGAAGYRTALIGKWHLGYPPHFGPRLSGYHEFFGFHSGGTDYFAHTGPRGGKDLWDNETPVDVPGYLTDLLSQRAVEFIERQDAQTPFLLSLHYSAPHWPWLTRDDEAESARTASNGVHTDGGSINTYHRMIHHMDEGIGWVLDALTRKGLANDTLVIFTSDNGGERFSNNWPFSGQKMDLLEGGIRVPLLARWPSELPAGQVSGLPSLTMDWTATVLAAAGVRAPASHPLDGVDLMPGLRDAAWQRPGPLAWRMKHRNQRALVHQGWKYLQVDGIDYLFNLQADARERANVARRHPERLADLKARWEDWNAQLPPIPEDAQSRMPYSRQEIPG
jgi:arylsulfatase A-like enzyme